MAREILGGFGPERTTGPESPSGGVKSSRDVMGYAPPQGPTNIMDRQSPGLHGDNCGNCGSQGYTGPERKQSSGSPGIGGRNKGNSGSQR